MAPRKKRGLKKNRQQGIRRKVAGNDPDLGKFEARWSPLNADSFKAEVSESPRKAREPTFKSETPAQPPNNLSPTWYDILSPPNVRWIYREVGVEDVGGSSAIDINLLEVPKRQVFVIVEWTPTLLFRGLRGMAGMYFPVLPDSFAYNLGASLKVSGTNQLIQSTSSFTQKNLSDVDDVIDATVAGTYRMNVKAFNTAGEFPLALYAGEESSILVSFSLPQTASLSNAFTTTSSFPASFSTDGGGIVFGSRILGFFAGIDVIQKLLKEK